MNKNQYESKHESTHSAIRYSAVSIALHWMCALLIVGLFASGLWQVELTYYDPLYKTLPFYHKSFGLLLLGAMVLRIGVRIGSNPVVDAPGLSAKQLRLAHLGHRLLYVLVFFVIAMGLGVSMADGRSVEFFNWFSVPALPWHFDQQESVLGELHELGAFTLIALVVGHMAISFWHGRAILKRMWF